MSATAILADLQKTAPTAQAIARSLVTQAQRKNKNAPSQANLAEAMMSIAPESHMQGASVVKVVIMDPMHSLIDAGFFSPSNVKGMLDDFDLNYPDGSRYWWRLTNYAPQRDGTTTLTFTNRAAAKLMALKGPLKAARSQKTRAEFLQMVARAVPEIQFFSHQLHVKQPIDSTQASQVTNTTPASATSAIGSLPTPGPKAAGLGKNTAGLTVKGAPINAQQIKIANIVLAVGEHLNAPEAALVASIYAAMGESNMEDVAPAGVFQTTGVPSAYGGGHDTAAQAQGFFTGGTSFANGGAIKLAQAGHPPWQIANAVELNAVYLQSGGSGNNPNGSGDSYAHQFPGGQAQGLREAQAIVQAAGGAALPGGALGGGVTIDTQSYNFEIGTTSNPNESRWDGMTRLAQEVNWELFLDGDSMYYDSEMTLARQKPAAKLGRDDPAVVDWNYEVELRNIATQMTLILICDPFEFHAGEVIQLDDTFGVAGEASTAGLPGRWLIADIVRVEGSLTSTFTLKQPEQPKNEPAPQASTSATGITGGGISGGVSLPIGGTAGQEVTAAYNAAVRLDSYKRTYSIATRQLTDPPPAGLDCSSSSAWVLWKAGIYGGPTSWAWTVEFAHWGQPGRGQWLTLWILPNPGSAGHVFLEFTLPGKHMQMNTSNDFGTGRGPRFGPWGGPGAADAASGTFIPRHWPGT